MRKWIDIVVENYHEDIASGYDRFVSRWTDHMYDEEMALENPVPDFAQYNLYATEVATMLAREPLYRGISAPLTVLDDDSPLGIFWSRDKWTAQDFTREGGTVYDNRFSTGLPDAVKIVFTIMPVTPDMIDIVETTVVTVAGGEAEVTLKMGMPVTITNVMVNGEEIQHPIIGKTRLT